VTRRGKALARLETLPLTIVTLNVIG